MSRLRIATEDDFRASSPSPIISLKNLGDIYLVLHPYDLGVGVGFVKIVKLTGAPFTESTIEIPKLIFSTGIRLTWWDRLIGNSLEHKVLKLIKKWKSSLKEIDNIIDITGAKYLAASSFEGD